MSVSVWSIARSNDHRLYYIITENYYIYDYYKLFIYYIMKNCNNKYPIIILLHTKLKYELFINWYLKHNTFFIFLTLFPKVFFYYYSVH